jgi:Flp pilus assembly protein CpaB
LVLAVILTLLINISATKKYAAASETVDVLQATRFIPVGEQIDPGMVKTVAVPAQVADGLATSMAAVAGKSARVSILSGQYLMRDDVDSQGRDPGCVEIYVSVNVPGGAWALPGDYVDVWQRAGQNSPSVLLVARVKVLHTVDADARQAEPGQVATDALGSGAAVAVGIQVPEDQAAKVVGPASQNEIYLVQSTV